MKNCVAREDDTLDTIPLGDIGQSVVTSGLYLYFITFNDPTGAGAIILQ